MWQCPFPLSTGGSLCPRRLCRYSSRPLAALGSISLRIYLYHPGVVPCVCPQIVSRMEQRKILKMTCNDEGQAAVALCGSNNREYLFLASLLWHMIDSYWLAAVSLYSLFNLQEAWIRIPRAHINSQTSGQSHRMLVLAFFFIWLSLCIYAYTSVYFRVSVSV